MGLLLIRRLSLSLLRRRIDTLETKAYNPFHMNSQTFTAHPKLDMKTGELVGFVRARKVDEPPISRLTRPFPHGDLFARATRPMDS